ncbi:MAG TPA: hypothetical protein DEG69_07815, partial [Flavobacteriaceae bacterium]|nr:hypothetical protein [Flavobacteriaceae bacterium]
MEHIAIIFYALSSFFGIEDGLIAAEKTEVTIYPKVQQIEIRQEGMFTIIQSKKDSTLVLEQWDKIFNWVERGTNFAKELNNFPVKKLTITSSKSGFSPYLTFSYLNEKDLRTMGIWYN